MCRPWRATWRREDAALGRSRRLSAMAALGSYRRCPALGGRARGGGACSIGAARDVTRRETSEEGGEWLPEMLQAGDP
jgi:hypothetical protein